MAITKTQAEATVSALKGLNGSALASRLADNKHLFEKHLAKAKALGVAKNGDPQGYFEREQTYEFANSTQFKELKEKNLLSQHRLDKWLERKGLYTLNKKTAPRVKGSMTVTNEMGAGDLGALLVSTFAHSAYLLCQSHQQPDKRFLFVTSMPDGFVGREVNAAGVKSKDVNWVVVVVEGTAVDNPQLVTIYPAREDYVNGLTALA